MPVRTEWCDHFHPEVIAFQSPQIRRYHALYCGKGGDMEAANCFVTDMVSTDVIFKIDNVINNDNIIFVPVSALESKRS